MSEKNNPQFTDKETAQRRDDALRNALNTPPDPKKGRAIKTPKKKRKI